MEAGRAHPRVGGPDGDLGDAQLGAGDLRVDGHTALSDLRHRRVHGDDGAAADGLQADPGGGVVVEALGEADVLDADGVADAAHDALAVRGVGQAAGQLPYVGALAGLPLALRRHRHRLDAAQEFGDRRRGVDGLSGGHERALLHGVDPAELHRVQAESGRHLVHLRLVGEARLDRAEAAHGAAGRVVGVEGEGLDVHVVDHVRSHRERGGVADDGRGGGGVGAAVQDDAAPHVGEAGRRGWRRARSGAWPGGGGRGRRRTRSGCRPS